MEAVELTILDWIQNHIRCGVLDAVLPAVSRLSDHGEIWILLAAVLLAVPKWRRAGLAVACALLLELVACNILLKPLIGRARPFTRVPGMDLLVAPPGDNSFPSGHTGASFAAAWALRRAGNPLWRPALVLASLVALSRLYLYVHWPTDVAGGVLLGMAAGWLGAKAAETGRKAE